MPAASETVADPAPDLLTRHAQVLRPEGHLRLDRRADDLLGRILEHRADRSGDVAQAFCSVVVRRRADGAAELAGIGMRNQAVDRPDEGALATARRTRDEQHLAGVDGQREVPEGGLRRPAIPKREPLDLDRAGRPAGRSGAPDPEPLVEREPSRRATSPWLSASARCPNESSISSEAPTATRRRSAPDRPLLDGRGAVVDRELDDQRPAGGERPDPRLEVGRHAGQRDVAEDQDMDDDRSKLRRATVGGSPARRASRPAALGRRPRT